MSYDLYFDNGEGAQVASVKGWNDCVRWAETLDAGDFPEVRHLAAFGWSQELESLVAELNEAVRRFKPEESVRQTITGMLEMIAAHNDMAATIVISDGTGVEDAEI